VKLRIASEMENSENQSAKPKVEGEPSKSSSNQNEQSKKMNEILPMELAQPQNVEEGRNGFKKFFMRLGEQVGAVKTSEFSQEYLDAVKNADQYKELVAELCTAVMGVCQPNPKFVPSAFSKMEFECPKDADPIEKLAHYIPSLSNFFPDKEAVNACRDVAKNLAQAHRKLQQQVRRSLHFMRTFLNVECAAIDEERRVLISCRRDMDYACHEYTNNPVESKRITFERAQQRFNNQMVKVFDLLNQIPQKKINHSIDMLNVLSDLQIYHETCYTECQKLRKYRPQFGPPTPFELL